MDQPLKPPADAPAIGSPGIKKPRPRRRFFLSLVLILIVVGVSMLLERAWCARQTDGAGASRKDDV